MTITTLAVNSNNDIYLDKNNNLAIVSDLEAVVQHCNQVVQVALGELVLDTSKGIPYFSVIFVGTPNLKLFEDALKNAILGAPGVKRVVTLRTERQGNSVIYAARISTIYGIGEFSGEVNGGL